MSNATASLRFLLGMGTMLASAAMARADAAESEPLHVYVPSPTAVDAAAAGDAVFAAAEQDDTLPLQVLVAHGLPETIAAASAPVVVAEADGERGWWDVVGEFFSASAEAPPSEALAQTAAPAAATPAPVSLVSPEAPVVVQKAEISLVPEAAPESVPEAALAPSAGSAPAEAAKTEPAKTESAAPTEPVATLDSATQKTLERVPSRIDTPAQSASEHIELTRATPTQSSTDETALLDDPAFTPNAENQPATGATTKRRMNVQVNTKIPAFDANYELERAYNALLVSNYEAAVRIYQQVLDNAAGNKNALFGLAATYHRIGQIDKARPLYVRLLKLDPTHREGLNNFLALAAEEAPEQALMELQKLQERNPDFSPIPAQMALICQRMGRLDDAVNYMLRAMELAPENLTYRYNLAVLFDRSNRGAEAASIYSQLLESALRGETLPGSAEAIQSRLTYLRAHGA